MKKSKSYIKGFIFVLIVTMSIVCCTESMRDSIFFALDVFGIVYPREPMLELRLNEQATEEPFSFADYCREEYDSVVFLYPYSNTGSSEFVNLKMSNTLRGICDNHTMFDTFSTILFVKNGKVKAYSIVGIIEADFASKDNTDNPRFYSFEQRFILDKDRNVHLYSE